MNYTTKGKFFLRKGINEMTINRDKLKKKQSNKTYFAKLGLWLLAAYILFFTTLIEDISHTLDNFGGVEPVQVEEVVETPPAQITPMTPPAPKKTVSAPCDKVIKGNVSSSGDKIYHVPGGDFYDKTVAEEAFCTPAEARAAGYRKSKK